MAGRPDCAIPLVLLRQLDLAESELERLRNFIFQTIPDVEIRAGLSEEDAEKIINPAEGVTG